MKESKKQKQAKRIRRAREATEYELLRRGAPRDLARAIARAKHRPKKARKGRKR